jgi:hypothetical protein
MREVADLQRIRRFMKALAAAADAAARVYFTGGATAVIFGWRHSTIDVDIRVEPDTDALFRAIPRIKESLHLNVELASPVDFIPVRTGWQDRSPFIAREGRVSFHHFDLYAQALAKVERGHQQDIADVREMLTRDVIEPSIAWQYFTDIQPQLHRYPAVDPASFRQSMEEMFGPPSTTR